MMEFLKIILTNLYVTSTEYTQDGMSAIAAESRVMTYKMLGVDGTEVQATALVFVPKTAAPAGGWKPLYGRMEQLVWQISVHQVSRA